MSTDHKTALEQEVRRLQVIHPTPEDIPSCIHLLDDFLMCHALGSQLKSLYRYGRQSECSRKYADFKYCLGIRSLEPAAKRDAWIQHRAEWWAERRFSKSSEDVWDVRTEPLQNFPDKNLLSQLEQHKDIS